jgi:hypothetical protein
VRIQPARGRTVQRQSGLRKTSAVGAGYGRQREHRRACARRRVKIGIRQDIVTASLDQNGRVTRPIKWATATNAVCMEKQSMDRAAAFERFFLA